MRRLILFFLFTILLHAQAENPGPFNAGSTTALIQRNLRSLNTTIYYPAFSAGTNTVADTVHGPYPVIVFGHGFLTQVSWYTTLLRHLCSYGYIVAAPQFPDTQHGELADDMLYVINWIHAENKNTASLLYRIADTVHTGVTGHSMGGGASLLAASRSKKISLAAPFAPAETTPSAIAVVNLIRCPVYLLAGQNDGITPVATNQTPMYNNALPCKSLNILKGGNHVRFMDNASFDFTDNNGYLTRTEQLRLTRRYLTSACNLFLKGDTSAGKYLFGAVPDSQIIQNFAAGPVMPYSFSLISPSGNQSSNNLLFTWHPSKPLVPGNTVWYQFRLYSKIASGDSTLYEAGTADTFLTAFNISAGSRYWSVNAYTSDSTCTWANNALQIQVPIISGVREAHTTNRLLYAYPNPAGGFLHLNGAEDGTAEIYNSLGQRVCELRIQGTGIDITGSGLAPGVYYCALPVKGIRTAVKFIIAR